ncbi:CsgE family curli-type amyloid fiber assembly protein [uncultured Hymenobacter sp.]|uniref:CsgE family curli-type amyloid fiber assembly protein n=1 Tax=uncultured Hymenobacter sp. TaxID=170016 RepID=UPI0035CAE356
MAGLLVLLASHAGRAQTRGIPTPPPARQDPPAKPAAPGGTLPASKVEEALRLLLKATAPDSTQTGSQRPPEMEINGLILDQTITKLGRDFYALFYEQWDPAPNLGDYTVIIREKPGRGTSTLISVEVNDNALVELPLSPNYEALEEAAAYSLSLTNDYLINARNVSQQLEQTADNPGSEVY